MKKQSLKLELLDTILQETEELIKIFVTSIKTAEKKWKQSLHVRYLVFVFIRRWTFDVRRSSLETSPYSINATYECLQNNLALMVIPTASPFCKWGSGGATPNPLSGYPL
jgi:hypothetical protein